MRRFLVIISGVLMVISAVSVPLFFGGGGEATAAPVCSLPPAVGGIITLTGGCDTTVPLTIPNGDTLDGAGFTITAHDTTGNAGSFVGGVVTNASGAKSMHVEKLTIQGTGFHAPPACGRSRLDGIFFNGAGGSVTGVTVTGITEGSGCQIGKGIEALGSAGETLTITNTKVSGYQKNGIDGHSLTMDVSASTMGPPAPLVGVIGQNGLVYAAGASGKTSSSTIYGSASGLTTGAGSAVALSAVKGVTITNNTLTGEGTDDGIFVFSASTGVTISNNKIGRTGADSTIGDPDGIGVNVFTQDGSTATLICNTFSGWRTDIVGALQISCTPLPAGTECHAYSAHLPTVDGGIGPFNWSVESGTLPPGLTLAKSGEINGTPTKAGTFDFTAKVTDSSSPPLTDTQAQSITIHSDCAAATTTTVQATTTTTTATTTTTPAAPVAPVTSSNVPVTG
jgi:hypothetical protein